MDRADLHDDPRYARSELRVAAIGEVDDLIEAWSSALPTDEVFDRLRSHDVPCSVVRSLADVVADQHLRDRGMVQDVAIEGVGVLPLFHSPLKFEGEERLPLRPSPGLGEHNHEVFGELLGRSAHELAALAADGVI
jgi:formyl-CoA transferase